MSFGLIDSFIDIYAAVLIYLFIDFKTALVIGHRFSNPNEIRINAEMEICRQIRDKLGGAVEQWR